MTVLYLVLLIASAVCFALAALNINDQRIGLLPLGLLLWVLVPLLQTLKAV